MEEKQLNMPDEHPVPKKKRKGKAGRILLLLILILVAGAAIGYYFYERSQPAKELDKYLTGIQSLDFDTMESMLQSADLSALDNADVRNATYESFFKSINAKMTWKITKTRFSFQDGTATPQQREPMVQLILWSRRLPHLMEPLIFPTSVSLSTIPEM